MAPAVLLLIEATGTVLDWHLHDPGLHPQCFQVFINFLSINLLSFIMMHCTYAVLIKVVNCVYKIKTINSCV